MVEYYMRKEHAEFLDKLVLGLYPNFPLGIYQPVFLPFQLESYYVCDYAS